MSNNTSCALSSYFNDEEQQSLKLTEEFRLKSERAWKGTEERFLNSDDPNSDQLGWRSEALAVIEDIKQFVTEIHISQVLPCDENGIYLNLETKENASLTVELSSAGFRVCGHRYDSLEADENCCTENPIKLNVYYETPYALLDSISPAYRNSFSSELAQRLSRLTS